VFRKHLAGLTGNARTYDDLDDDLAFLFDASQSKTRVMNDIVYLDRDSAKHRLAISYGIAQSTVLAAFEGETQLRDCPEFYLKKIKIIINYSYNKRAGLQHDGRVQVYSPDLGSYR
jgi:hypothetical protein